MAACLTRGMPRVACDDVIASHRVDGVHCDGTIVQDQHGKRCVTRKLAARVRDARNASPLPVADPSTPAGVRWAVVLGLGGLIAIGIWAATR